MGEQRDPKVYEEGTSRKFRGLDQGAALELLAILDAATSLQDLSPLKSVGLHRLKGDRAARRRNVLTANRIN